MIDYQKLKDLRAETQVSFSLCKKALEESANNMDEAKKLLKAWGIKKAEGKSDRETKAGGIFTYVHHNKLVAGIVEVQCETDFVSGNEAFQHMGNEFAMQIATTRVQSVEEFRKQEYIRDSSKTIDDMIKEAILKFGENIQIARFARWEVGE